MAWSWSHTAEAYQNARLNLEDLSRETLNVIAAEILMHERDLDYSSEGDYPTCLIEAGKMLDVEDFIWEFAEALATCDNGGYNAWMCPDGCHTVSFDREEKE